MTDQLSTAPVATTEDAGPAPRKRGLLRVYLGATPGSGKTFAMLREARERRDHGEDAVVGFVESHGRKLTEAMVDGLEVIPRIQVEYQGKVLEEMDLDAVLARKPQVALVDELAHTNVPGVRHEKRWQDVEELRDAGIDVITTVNVQHAESVKDLVEHITGIPVRETVPDSVLDGADEIQFIDISPEALRKRMKHGNVYAPEKIDTALRNFFRPGNLAALREIALRLVAQSVGDRRAEVRPAPEDVLVAVSGRPGSDSLVRRGARIARRYGGVCTVLRAVAQVDHVDPESVARLQKVTTQLACPSVERVGPVHEVVPRAARGLAVRHVVIGEARDVSLVEHVRGGVVDVLIRELPDVNIHVIARTSRPVRSTTLGQERPDADALLRSLNEAAARRGRLRVYVGYARGCGTTTAMLDEGRRRHSRGTDVVVATVRTEGRSACESVLSALPILGGPQGPAVRGILDLSALMRRNPEVVCIDDIGGVDTRGRPIVAVLPRILGAGITVVGTLRLADLASVRESLGPMLGSATPDHPPLDDAILGMFDELEIVDVTPSVLDERLRRGEIVRPEDAARALQTDFRPEVLEMLRETAFRIIASHTDRRLVDYMHEARIERPWEARPRVMLCVPPRSGMEPVIRRAARYAASLDADFTAVTVRDRPRSEEEKLRLGAYAALTHQLGGEFVTVYEKKPAQALATYAQRILATEIIVTRGRHRRWGRSTLRQLINILSDVDVHVLSVEDK